MDYLDKLESRSIYILREAFSKCRNMALLWSAGKDSTTMVWIARKAFLGHIPFPVIHIDTSFHFKELYEFREQYQKEWELDLLIVKNEKAGEKGIGPGNTSMDECCHALKTVALKNCREKHEFKALLFAIRGDDQGMPYSLQGRDNRNGPSSLWDMHVSTIQANDHVRIHPMQHWTLPEIWKYIKREKLPVVPLYFSKNGKRYRGIGCKDCCTMVDSSANTIEKIIKETEKAGKSGQMGSGDDDVYTIRKLKSLGYM